MQVDFDPDDDNIPQKLRNRFLSWMTEVPRLQYSQYGPINKYLTLKFPDAMVKPQGLMRPIMTEREVQIVVGQDGILGEDGLLDVGNISDISIDSTGQYVSKEEKRYPDFIVASYYDDNEKYDKIRLIVEIGSLHKREAASNNVKKEIQKQLHEYMVLLGDEGARWATNVLGVAILGTEVCFSRPRKRKEDGSIMFTMPSKWHSLYDDTFVKEINKVAKMLEDDADD
ncbi:hypothetical protein M378DRAFT_196726 [Amanita muscaria Koide BX008]|uniref:Uncharacterized protein n=1 Tax=Amanita muscaria (strain Koide BX008) TaxID=946122 RepID=A0A0C2SXN6_AMAMK|nr:hypothetical protein M378DRAFT_196726 [Amanita muscaria Koide BX008]